MRDQLGLPIEYDQLNFGFIYTEPVTSFPSIEVSEGEVVALFVAQKAMEQYRGTSFEKPLRTAFEKITEGLKDWIGFQWDDVDSAISFRGLGTSVACMTPRRDNASSIRRSASFVIGIPSAFARKYSRVTRSRRSCGEYHLGRGFGRFRSETRRRQRFSASE